MKVLVALLAFGMLASVAFAGTITGTVMYDGDAPARPALTATKDQHCIDAVAGTKSEALVVSKSKGIKNVVIYARVRGANHKRTLLFTRASVAQKLPSPIRTRLWTRTDVLTTRTFSRLLPVLPSILPPATQWHTTSTPTLKRTTR